MSRLERERHEAQKRVDVALAKLHESDATLAAVAEELGQFGAQARAARGEAERLERAIGEAQEARDEGPRGARRPRGAAGPRRGGPRSRGRAPTTASSSPRPPAAPGRARWRPGSRCAPPRSGRAPCTAGPTSCCAPPSDERETRAREIERRARLLREGEAAQAVGAAVAYVLDRLDVSIGRAAAARAEVERARQGREEQLLAVRARLRDLAREHDELVNSVHRDEMARTQQRMRIEQLEERALEELGLDGDVLVAEYGPDQPVPVDHKLPDGEQPEAAESDESDGRGAGDDAVRPRGAAEAAARRRARAGDARHRQPARAGGVQRAGGAAPVPRRAARGPEADPQGPPRHRPRGRRPRRAGLHRGLRRRGAGLRGDLRPALPGRRGPAGPHRPRRHAQHRHRGRGAAARQEDQAALAALRWGALAGRGGVPGGAVQGPPLAVLHPRRGRGRARRHQPRPAAGDLRGAARELPAAGDHPPEADHGGRRRALRRHDARRRRLRGDQPAAARGDAESA